MNMMAAFLRFRSVCKEDLDKKLKQLDYSLPISMRDS